MTPQHSQQTEAGKQYGLREYTRYKLRIAEIIQAVLPQTRKRHDEIAESDCRSLLSRLASDRFNLAVIGQFNRGKSTLMNAVLGVDRLPTGVLPLTSVITSVCYGEHERVLLHRSGGMLPVEVPLARLGEYVTETGNPGNRLGIAVAEVQLPIELLRLGFHFVDTPGVGSAIVENTRTTRAFLPEVDAAIFVTSFDSPLDERELDLLHEVLAHVKTVFVVVNKSDVVSPAQKEAVVSFVLDRLPVGLASDRPVVFPVSALHALRSRLEGDAEGVRQSGILDLEEALLRFLRTEKTRDFVLRIASRTLDLIRKQEASLHLSQMIRSSPERSTELGARLRERTDSLRRELGVVLEEAKSQTLLAVRKSIATELAEWIRQLAVILLDEARDWLSHASGEELLGPPDELASRIDAACRDSATGWLAGHHAACSSQIESEIERAQPVIDRILLEANGVMSEFLESGPGTPPAATSFKAIQDRTNLAWPVLPPLAWTPRWWVTNLWLVPATLLRQALLRHLSRSLEASLVLYSDQILGLIERAVEHAFTQLRNHLDGRIEAEGHGALNALIGEDDGDALAAIENLRLQLDALRAEVEAMPTAEEPMVPPSRRGTVSEAVSSEPNLDLRAKCSVCERVVLALFKFMSAQQFQLSVNADQRRRHVANLGFCTMHTWSYEQVASPQGICLAYPLLLDSLSAGLRALASSGASPDNLLAGVTELAPASAKCPACRLVIAVERAAVQDLLRSLPIVGAENTVPPPLCLPHLHSVLRAKPAPEQARHLLVTQAQVFERLAEDMRSYALKHEGIRRDLATNAEYTAHKAALMRLVGYGQGLRIQA